MDRRSIGVTEGSAAGATELQHIQSGIKGTDFVDTIILKFLRDLHFSLDQQLKSAVDLCNGTMNNIINTQGYVDKR